MSQPQLDKIGIGLENGEYYIVDKKDVADIRLEGIVSDVFYAQSSHIFCKTIPIIRYTTLKIKAFQHLFPNGRYRALQEFCDLQNISQIHIYHSNGNKDEYLVYWDSNFATRNRCQKTWVDKNGNLIIDIHPLRRRDRIY